MESTVRTNNNGTSATQGHEQVQFVTMNHGYQHQRGNSSDGAAPRITIPLRTSSRGRAIRVTPGSRHQPVQIVGNAIQATTIATCGSCSGSAVGATTTSLSRTA